MKVQDGRVFTHPIAGSKPRGATPEQDADLEAELLADPKEQAEHLMLVDLARNDLAKVCIAGSVEVTEFMQVERFSHIMHLVSSVEGDLAPGCERRSTCSARPSRPARCRARRSRARSRSSTSSSPPSAALYGGVVGYFGFGGDADLAIAIRTATISGGIARVQAGGGLVADSDPESEYPGVAEQGRGAAARGRRRERHAEGRVTAARLKLAASSSPRSSGAALALLAWSQTWFELGSRIAAAQGAGEPIAVAGSVASPALAALGLAGLALVAALAIAGPGIRIVLGVLEVVLGGCVLLAASASRSAIRSRPSRRRSTDATGVSGPSPTAAARGRRRGNGMAGRRASSVACCSCSPASRRARHRHRAGRYRARGRRTPTTRRHDAGCATASDRASTTGERPRRPTATTSPIAPSSRAGTPDSTRRGDDPTDEHGPTGPSR